MNNNLVSDCCHARFLLNSHLLEFDTGLGDATTPLLCSFGFNLLNLCLDFMFLAKWKLGVAGAAYATTLAQTAALVPMIGILHQKVNIRFQGNLTNVFQSFQKFVWASIYLLGRSIIRAAATSFCTRQSVSLIISSKMKKMFTFPLECSM